MGKSALAKQFVHARFQDDYDPTISGSSGSELLLTVVQIIIGSGALLMTKQP